MIKSTEKPELTENEAQFIQKMIEDKITGSIEEIINKETISNYFPLSKITKLKDNEDISEFEFEITLKDGRKLITSIDIVTTIISNGYVLIDEKWQSFSE